MDSNQTASNLADRREVRAAVDFIDRRGKGQGIILGKKLGGGFWQGDGSSFRGWQGPVKQVTSPVLMG